MLQHGARLTRKIRTLGLPHTGQLAAVVRFSEEAEELKAHGISTFNLYAQAGAGFAAHASEKLRATSPEQV